MLYEISQFAIVRYVGLIIVLKFIVCSLYSIYGIIRSRLFPKDFRKLGEWVVVTGSTDGIGKELARGFAGRGMNIVLISRSEAKLKNTAEEIEKEFHVKTKCIQADFTDRSCYKNIRTGLENLDIGVLVNNVGIGTPSPTRFWNFTEERLWNEIDVNCGAATIMTSIVVPQMKAKRKGLIINNSSLASEYGLAYFGTYSPTKAYLTMFSRIIKEDLLNHNVKVQCLIPGFVETKLIDEAKPFIHQLEKKASFISVFAPDAKTFAEYTMHALSTNEFLFTGYWGHTLATYLLSWVPTEFRMKLSATLVGLWVKEAKKQAQKSLNGNGHNLPVKEKSS